MIHAPSFRVILEEVGPSSRPALIEKTLFSQYRRGKWSRWRLITNISPSKRARSTSVSIINSAWIRNFNHGGNAPLWAIADDHRKLVCQTALRSNHEALPLPRGLTKKRSQNYPELAPAPIFVPCLMRRQHISDYTSGIQR
jgi:hypothetical protein